MSKIYYEVWGWDTFSSESYFCASFDTEEEAEEYIEVKERECAEYQDEGLRDNFGILPVTDQDRVERANKREEYLERRRREVSYNAENLSMCVELLLGKLMVDCLQYKVKPKGRRGNRLFNNVVKWSGKDDCFTQITITTFDYLSNDDYIICLELAIRSGVAICGQTVSQGIHCSSSIDNIIEWIKSNEAYDMCIAKIDKFIENIYYDDL